MESKDVPPAGGRRSFEDFFDAEHPRLFRALCLVTRNRHEAEEIMQDAFLATLERWDRTRIEDPVGYLYRVAMNAFRKRTRRAVLGARRTVGLIRPDDSIETVDARDAAVRALAPLSRQQRAAVVLMDLFGYTSEEAGQLLGIRPSTVRMHASRAHAALRATMGGDR